MIQSPELKAFIFANPEDLQNFNQAHTYIPHFEMLKQV